MNKVTINGNHLEDAEVLVLIAALTSFKNVMKVDTSHADFVPGFISMIPEATPDNTEYRAALQSGYANGCDMILGKLNLDGCKGGYYEANLSN